MAVNSTTFPLQLKPWETLKTYAKFRANLQQIVAQFGGVERVEGSRVGQECRQLDARVVVNFSAYKNESICSQTCYYLTLPCTCRQYAGRARRMQDTGTDTATDTDRDIKRQRVRQAGRLARATLSVVMAQSGHNFNFYERVKKSTKATAGPGPRTFSGCGTFHFSLL